MAFAGNNLRYVIRPSTWMEERSPFDIDDLIDTACAPHCEAPSHDDVEFIVCESESVTDGRICCIKGGHIYEDVDVAWIGSPLTFRELQRIRLGITQDGDGEVWPGSPPRADPMTAFAESIRSAADDSVGGFVINAPDGTRLELLWLGDRNFYSYNSLCHLLEAGHSFIIRMQDDHVGRLLGEGARGRRRMTIPTHTMTTTGQST